MGNSHRTILKNLTVDNKNHICTIVISRESVRNALDPETFAEISQVLKEIEADTEVYTVVITGSGEKSFASGADIRSLNSRNPMDILNNPNTLVLNQIDSFRKPIIAAINGFALGGGCELALTCDLRIASKNAKFGLPELNLGIVPGGGGTQRLARVVGLGKAKELILTGKIIDADEAKSIGLISEVLPDRTSLMDRAQEIAAIMASKGPIALQLAKSLINQSLNIDVASGINLEKLAQTILFYTEDKREGVTAFLEKRKAEFKGI